jgi:hypothetical protein
MNFLPNLMAIPLRWWFSMLVSAAGFLAASLRIFESEQARAKRAERKRQKDLRSLADEIATYGQDMHRRFPTGAVVVSERDLAEQLRKRPDAVATALHLLLEERKVERAPLGGYWRLHV